MQKRASSKPIGLQPYKKPEHHTFEQKLPAARDAIAWMELNRKHRRAAVARMQGSTRNKWGDVTKRSLRKHAQAVRYAKGVADFGVCPTQPRPIDGRF